MDHWNPWTWMRVWLCQVASRQRSHTTRAGGGQTAKHRRRRGNKIRRNVVAKGGRCRVCTQFITAFSKSFSTESWVKCMRLEELWQNLSVVTSGENKQLTVMVTSCFFSRYLRLFILKRAGPWCQKFPLKNTFIEKTESYKKSQAN